jgi:hypothetical protein
MTAVTRTRVVAADPNAIWAVLADFASISGWAPNVDHSCLMSDRADGVDAVRRIQAGRNTVIERVVGWDEARSLAYTIEGLPPIIRSVLNRWDLRVTPAGTAVSLTTQVDAGPRPPQKAIAKVVAKGLARESDKLLDGLTRHLEGASL